MVDKLLGVPDGTAPNPRFRRAAPVRLYSLERVEAAEATEAYARLFEVGRARGKAAQRAAEARKATLLEAIAGMEVSVEKVRGVERLAIASYEAFRETVVEKDAPRSFLDRITVNFIRHNLTRYDVLLWQAAGKPGAEQAREAIRRRIFDAIGPGYPRYAEECDRQRLRKEIAP
jgi:hypothetical protein